MSDSDRTAKYVNDSHRWMDEHVLGGRYPDLYGYLVLVDHGIPAAEVWDRLRHWTEKYLSYGSDRTQRFHEIVDETIAFQTGIDVRDGYSPPYCRIGCTGCCCQPVACTDEEAELIFEYSAERGIPIDLEKIGRQDRHLEYDRNDDFTGETTWDDQPDEDRACAFLDTNAGSCTIWPVRPFVCRAQLAEGTNAHCRPHNGVPDPQSRAIHFPEASYILSAVFTVHHDSVGKMLCRLLRKAGGERTPL